MAHSVGKVAVNKVLSLDKEDVETFEKLNKNGVTFDVRKVPSDSTDNMEEILKKRKQELDNQLIKQYIGGSIMSIISMILVVIVAFLAGMEVFWTNSSSISHW